MTLILTMTISAVLMMAIALIAIFSRLKRAREQDGIDLDWCRGFSIASYPMERLFAEQDYHFLSAQPNLSPAVARRLQAERRRIFRRYLGELSRDFDRLLAAAKVLVVNVPEDRPELAKAIIRHRLAFSYALAVVRCRLFLSELGIGRVDVRPLVRALGNLRVQIGTVAEYAGSPAM